MLSSKCQDQDAMQLANAGILDPQKKENACAGFGKMFSSATRIPLSWIFETTTSPSPDILTEANRAASLRAGKMVRLLTPEGTEAAWGGHVGCESVQEGGGHVF